MSCETHTSTMACRVKRNERHNKYGKSWGKLRLNYFCWNVIYFCYAFQMGMPLSRRQKSWDILDQSAIAFARQHKVPAHQVC